MRTAPASLAAMLAICGAAWASKPTVPAGQSVAQADLVVVAKVVGMLDKSDAAKNRKEREAHEVEVLRTLKGVDCAGEKLRLRPNGLLLEDGKSYVLYIIRRDMTDMPELAQQMRTEATDANVKEAEKAVATAGGKVLPKRVLWMEYTAGWGGGMVEEFWVTPAGDFTYRNRQIAKRGGEAVTYEYAGKLEAKDVKLLAEKIAAAGKGPQAEDAGYVRFQWQDEKGKWQTKSYSMPREGPVVELRNAIGDLAKKNGKQEETAPRSKLGAETQPTSKPVSPGVDTRAVESLVRDLGAMDFKVREAATEKLKAMGKAAEPALKAAAAAKDVDPEVASRVAVLLEALQPLPTVTDEASGITVSVEADRATVIAKKGGKVLWQKAVGGEKITGLSISGGRVTISPHSYLIELTSGEYIKGGAMEIRRRAAVQVRT